MSISELWNICLLLYDNSCQTYFIFITLSTQMLQKI